MHNSRFWPDITYDGTKWKSQPLEFYVIDGEKHTGIATLRNNIEHFVSDQDPDHAYYFVWQIPLNHDARSTVLYWL
jgi:hypothetical protein